jgi:hypothetical protein
LGGGTTPLPIVYYVPLHKDYIQMSLFLETPKTGTLVIPKAWPLISFSNQIIFENVRAISCSPQNDLSNNV